MNDFEKAYLNIIKESFGCKSKIKKDLLEDAVKSLTDFFLALKKY